MIISHGNAEDIDGVREWLVDYFLHSVKINVIVYEYTGYNPTDTCDPSEKQIYDDILTVYHYAT